jgi:hypothetical protein
MKQSKLITVPIKAKSSKAHPEVHLAYITDKEQDLLIKKDLYGSLKGKPNRGPGGLPSLEGDFGKDGKTYEPAGPDVSARQATGEGGQKYTGTASPSGKGGKNIALLASAFTGNIKGVVANIASRFSPKKKEPTLTEKTAAMEDAYVKKYKPVPVGGGPGDRDGTSYMTPVTVAASSTTDTKDTKKGWGFKPYATSSTVKSRLYGKKGKMIKANQGEFSQGKRFGPPPNKGPDPQGIDAPLNSINYFKDLL